MYPSLQVRCLGRLEFLYKDEVHSSIRLLSNPPTLKSQSLLAYLIIHRSQPHSRNILIDMFWGDRSEKKARRSLSTALWQIRRCFTNQDLILGTTQSVQFSFQGTIQLDIEDFESHAAQANRADLKTAVQLYKSDFLQDFYDDWIVNERYRLQSLFIETLAKLMTLHEGVGDHNDALHAAQELLRFDALREDAHRLLMRTYCALGQRNTALEQYRSCQKVLKDELDVDPTPETSSLFRDIQSGYYEIGQTVPTVAASPTIRAIPTVRSPLDIAARQVLIGREKELSILSEQWARQCNLVLVTGEAGIGKTHFLETFAKNLSTQGTRVLWGRCYEFEHLLPYQPIAEALRPSLTGLTTEAISRLPEWVIGELGRLIPGMLAGRPKYEGRPSTSTDQDQVHLFAGVEHYLSMLSDSNRVLLVLEDLHWAAESTLELLHYLVRHTPTSGSPLLIVGSYRPESLIKQHPLKKLQRQLQKDALVHPLLLLPLSSENVEQLLYEISGRDETIIPLAQSLYQDTEGNPFFLVETLKALFETGEIALIDGTWQGDFDRTCQDNLPLPVRVSEIIQSRISRLDGTTQAALRVAAVLGGDFDFDLLTAVWKQDEEIVLDALDQMLRHQIIVEGSGITDRDYVFTHHKIQEVVYAEISLQRQQYLHGHAGHELEKLYGSQADKASGELAFHFWQGRNTNKEAGKKAVHYLIQAGDSARNIHANQDAIHY